MGEHADIKKVQEIIDRDTHDHDMTYENEQSMVTIPSVSYTHLTLPTILLV